MTITINGTTGISGVDGSAGTPSLQGQDTNTGFFYGTDILGFSTGGTERMRLDASGNLGLGVTPSAWGSAYKAIDIGSIGGISAATNATLLSVNTYYNSSGTAIYKTSNKATAYFQNANADGGHSWFIAPSGTAGNAITFTQAMTLDANGKLNVGTTTAASGASVQASFVNSSGGGIQFGFPTTGGGALVGNTSGGIQFYGYAGAQGSEGYTERMRIDSSGNVGIGTSTIGAKLTVSGSSGAQLLIGPYGSRTYSFNTRANGGYADAWCDVVSNSSVAGYTWQNQAGSLLTLTLNGTAVLLGGNATSNGVGITFPATQSASSDANTLDDYEEGTWTPSFSGASAVTYTFQYGRYIKVGRMVTIQAVIQWSAFTASGNLALGGVPFNPDTNTSWTNGLTVGVNNSTSYTQCYQYSNSTTFFFYTANGSFGSSATTNPFGSSGGISVYGTYFTAS